MRPRPIMPYGTMCHAAFKLANGAMCHVALARRGHTRRYADWRRRYGRAGHGMALAQHLAISSTGRDGDRSRPQPRTWPSAGATSACLEAARPECVEASASKMHSSCGLSLPSSWGGPGRSAAGTGPGGPRRPDSAPAMMSRRADDPESDCAKPGVSGKSGHASGPLACGHDPVWVPRPHGSRPVRVGKAGLPARLRPPQAWESSESEAAPGPGHDWGCA